MVNDALETVPVLRWHVPTRTQLPLRYELTLIACVTVVVAAIGYVVWDETIRLQLLGAIFLLGLLLAGWKTFRASLKKTGEPNVWLDSVGLHWQPQPERVEHLAREEMQSFWIGDDEATRQAVPSLTFLIRDGFLSQPLELHDPATPDATRQWLKQHWQLPAAQELPPAEHKSLELEVDYDDVRQLWLFRGSRAELTKMLAIWEEIATRYRLPPVGMRPQECGFECADASFALVIAPHCWIQYATLSIPPNRLQQLTQELRERFSAGTSSVETSLTCDTGHHWRLLLECDEPEQEVSSHDH